MFIFKSFYTEKFVVIFKILIFFFLTLLFFYGQFHYTGKKIIYLLFSILNIYLFFFSLRNNTTFFELFFGLLLFLGFGFKFAVIISFTDGTFKEGAGFFDYSPNSFDEVLVISSIGIISFLAAGRIRQFFFSYLNYYFDFCSLNKIYFKYRNRIILLFIILIFSVFLINIFFKVYQKGLISSSEINFIISGSIKWLLLFGLSSFSALIIYLELISKKKLSFFIIFLSIFETFISYVSMLSRGMIFNSLSILSGLYLLKKKFNIKINFSLFFKSLITLVIFFYFSLVSVNYIRSNFFYIGKSYENTNIDKNKTDTNIDKNKTDTNIIDKQIKNLSRSNNEILYLLVNRWVGIDAVMALQGSKNLLSFALLNEAMSEKPEINNQTFYERKFLKKDTIYAVAKYDKIKVKGNTLLGIIAFMYYSGSLFFLFFASFFACLIANFIEVLSLKLSFNNIIFSSLIGQTIAFRFIHFGYLPLQSYLLFGAIILNIFLIFLITKIFIK